MTGASVLVVDDEPSARELVESIMTVGGWQPPTHAADGVEALQKIDEEPCHILITDLDMPGQDGIELITALCSRGVAIPICVLTGVGSEEEIQRALAAGADLAFEKAGFGEGEFVDAVRDLVKEQPALPKHPPEESADDFD